MLARTNSALHLLILQLILDASLLPSILLRLSRLRLPVDRGAEDDILADRGRVERGARGVALFETELGPGSPLRDLRVDVLTDDGRLDPSGDLYFFAVVVEPVAGYGLGAVFVRCDLLRGECGGVVEFFVVRPVGAAVILKKFVSFEEIFREKGVFFFRGDGE
jgi:hypothetical protein